MIQHSLLEFAFFTVTVSLSGVMAPGPMTAVTIQNGTYSPFAGLLVSLGHTVIEIPLIFALFFGLQSISKLANITPYITVVGGIVLFVLATATLINLKKRSTIRSYSPVVDGIVLSACNPYFFVWWLTIGLTLIQKSIVFGTIGLVLFSLLHSACDYIWLFIISILSYAGASLLGKNFIKTVGIASGVMLYIFGIFFMYDAIKQILS